MTLTEVEPVQTEPRPPSFERPVPPQPVTGRRRSSRRRSWRPRLPPKRTRSGWQTIVAGVSLALGILAVWWVAYVLVISNVQEARSQHELYATFRAEVAQPFGSDPAPLGAPIHLGAPVATLDVPAAGMHHVVVVEGTTSGLLRAGPGHLPSSPLPGQSGYSVLFGRGSTFGAPFGAIGSLRPGDTIRVTTGEGVFRYQVVDVRRRGDAVPTLPAQSTGRLTLVSSAASGWRSGWAPAGVIYVDANLQGKAQPSAGPPPASVPASEQAMQAEGGPALLTQIVLLLQLLLLVSVVLVWLRTRWQVWQLWLVATPVLLVIVWGLTTSAVRLLPNLL
jgi:sortase A